MQKEHEKCLEIVFHLNAQIEPTLACMLHALYQIANFQFD